MTREFVWTTHFIKSWEENGLTVFDLRVLEIALCENPKAGDVISGTGGARKMRLGFKNGGKRGGLRIIYVDFEIGEKICGLEVYAKSDKDDISEAEKKELKYAIIDLKQYYDRS